MISKNTDSPTPQQREAMRQATAFAYGYASTMFMFSKSAHYGMQVTNLREDLRLLDCFEEKGITLKRQYLISWRKGRGQALSDLEGVD